LTAHQEDHARIEVDVMHAIDARLASLSRQTD